MRTYILDIIPKIQRYSQKIDDLTLLTNHHWVSVDNISLGKTVYIFRSNNELIIATDGKVEKAKWEYLGNRSLLIDYSNNSYLFKNGFADDNILALKIDGKNEYAVFVNENNHSSEINSIEKIREFLQNKYLDPSIREQKGIENALLTSQDSSPQNAKLYSPNHSAASRGSIFVIILIILATIYFILLAILLFLK